MEPAKTTTTSDKKLDVSQLKQEVAVKKAKNFLATAQKLPAGKKEEIEQCEKELGGNAEFLTDYVEYRYTPQEIDQLKVMIAQGEIDKQLQVYKAKLFLIDKIELPKNKFDEGEMVLAANTPDPKSGLKQVGAM